MNIETASDRLSQIDLSFELDGLTVKVLWFRVMRNGGEWLIRRHMHSSYEFHFVAAGGCRVAYAGGEFTAHAGQFYLTGPRMWHEQSSDGGAGYVEYSINCDIAVSGEPEYDGRLLLEAFRGADCRPVSDMGSIACFEKALAEAEEQRAGYYAMVRNLAAMILTLAARAIGGGRSAGRAPVKVGQDDFRFHQIEQFVRDNAGNRVTTDDLAKVFYLSSRQIGRIVRRHTGRSTQQYIRAVKLDLARRMLRETDYDISEISSRLGFTSVYSFSRFFKREEGYAPTLFRRNVRES